MEEIIVIFEIRFFDNNIGGSNGIDINAHAYNIPRDVYLALLSGGEAAIKSYCYGNTNIAGDKGRIISATMRVAEIKERGKSIQNNQGKIFSITPEGSVVESWMNSNFPTVVKNRKKNAKELIATPYHYDSPYLGFFHTTDVFAHYDDGSYEWIGPI